MWIPGDCFHTLLITQKTGNVEEEGGSFIYLLYLPVWLTFKQFIFRQREMLQVLVGESESTVNQFEVLWGNDLHSHWEYEAWNFF